MREVEQHYNISQAASLLAVSARTIWRLIEDGQIGRIRRIRRSCRIPASALQSYLDRNTARAPSA